jgi:hypothetical protein
MRSSTAEPSATPRSPASQATETTPPLSELSVSPLTSTASGADTLASQSSMS